MNRADIIKSVAEDQQVPVVLVQRIFASALSVIALSLSAGDDVGIRDFGKFERRHRRAVVRRNPKTGDEIPVPEKMSVGFVPSRTLKARLNVE